MTDREKVLEEALESMLYQFAYPCKGPAFTTGGLSALEEAFDVLGWQDPHPCPGCKCEIEDCIEHATCGSKVKDGEYKRMCGNHYRELGRKE